MPIVLDPEGFLPKNRYVRSVIVVAACLTVAAEMVAQLNRQLIGNTLVGDVLNVVAAASSRRCSTDITAFGVIGPFRERTVTCIPARLP
ncbi:hypothetical protein GGE12_005558 [Rhizobium mongolense]|uniref:Uncharacterized protein n=1 Tax=Rhizobium mongolense TaxID=57676 RepID=A0A7W6RSB5_9HYPH|nr:hypothetical protein [Rhizobium mongolense]